MKWRSVAVEKPRCPRGSWALGTPVLVWPRKQQQNERRRQIRWEQSHGRPYPSVGDHDGFAYYGRRATGKPAFYLHGAEMYGVTHWMPMPDGPKEAK